MVERWCGIECTVNRVGDDYLDQLVRSGHHWRLSDLDLLPEFGFSAIRYPLLWERISPDAPDRSTWTWSDERLRTLRGLGIRVIAGLVHHGSGPPYTDLLADSFAPGLARHAGAAARRYPWIQDWTPVNEPVTTARFSALYGHWYPHARDERSLWIALLNQIDATRLAMRAIRAINKNARLIQTDDLGCTWATSPLADQAAFDNQRRWAGWDLLCGKLTPSHPFWSRLCGFGLGNRLRAIADDPCPPEIIGINHYPTSNRFLDHRCQLYPAEVLGQNGKRWFADVPAARVLDPAPIPFTQPIREAWDRYRLPLALTEVHLGGEPAEQARWASAALAAAHHEAAAGVDIRAVTAWAVLGSFDWDTLVTAAGAYEPGLFDVRHSAPRRTALAECWRALGDPAVAQSRPGAAAKGWWCRSDRFLFARARRAEALALRR